MAIPSSSFRADDLAEARVGHQPYLTLLVALLTVAVGLLVSGVGLALVNRLVVGLAEVVRHG